METEMNHDSTQVKRDLFIRAFRSSLDLLLDDRKNIDYDTENFLMKELSSEVPQLAKWKGMDFSPINDLQDCIDFLTRVYPSSSYYIKKEDDRVVAFLHSVEFEVSSSSASRALFASACKAHLQGLEETD
jgi:hypothetical protein